MPCGRIYPIILIQLDDPSKTFNVTQGGELELTATLTYKFDVVNEGYTAPEPNRPVVISFEFPRKPGWAELSVEPEQVPVPVENPTYVQPDLDDPASPQGHYVYTTQITIRASLNGQQPVLRDGTEYAKLLVFAKSSESGLYQSGYGIKELRVVPDEYVFESALAGTRDVFTPQPLPPAAVPAASNAVMGTTLTVGAADGAKFWEPTALDFAFDPAPEGSVVLALHDERGNLVASTPPVDASGGSASLPVTFVHPGLHTATATLLPPAGTATPPLTIPVALPVGSTAAEGWEYPKMYAFAATEALPAPAASADDPLAQFERDIPFFAFDHAQSTSATVTLLTPGAADLGRGAANLQFSLHDPDGNLLQASSVDPTNPQRSVRVGSLPAEGWYVLRVKGVGLPAASAYEARVEVAYPAPPVARNRADGAIDATGGTLALAGANLTLPVEDLAVWAPGDLTPQLSTGAAFRHQITVYDANLTLAYAGGLRGGAASFTPPAPGSYRAFVLAQPVVGGAPFPLVVRAFSFDVGAGQVTVAQSFSAADSFEVPTSAGETLVGAQRVAVREGAGAPALDVQGGRAVVHDMDGNELGAEVPSEPGDYLVMVLASNPSPQPAQAQLALDLSYAAPVSLAGPQALAPAGGAEARVPGLAIGLALAAIGAVAVATALLRRR